MRPLEKPFEEFGDVRLKAIIMRRRQTRTHACTAAGDCFERVKDIQTCFKAYKVVARGRKADPVKVLLSVAGVEDIQTSCKSHKVAVKRRKVDPLEVLISVCRHAMSTIHSEVELYRHIFFSLNFREPTDLGDTVEIDSRIPSAIESLRQVKLADFGFLGCYNSP
ncbi:hypothetical protein E3N88_36525 [Mikania micrantha]|uniref:Uncharacterized protein n=1 Tax=Mikania micrantha TaxID=192012 RepID=A0A5N6M401_9ASTR|nr:hypothetical protein E3N88_36525 [Mikania micrantha]